MKGKTWLGRDIDSVKGFKAELGAWPFCLALSPGQHVLGASADNMVKMPLFSFLNRQKVFQRSWSSEALLQLCLQATISVEQRQPWMSICF